MTTISKYIGTFTAIVGLVLWVLNYFHVDITFITDALGIEADLIGGLSATGLLALASTSYVKSAQLTMVDKTSRIVNEALKFMLDVKDVVESLKLELSHLQDNQFITTEQQNVSNALLVEILKFDKLLADKNKDSELLTDAQKADIKLWTKRVEERVRNLKVSKSYDIKRDDTI